MINDTIVMDYTEEQIKELFEKLPEDVRGTVTSVEVENKLQQLANKYRLHVDKVDELFDETTLVMLGITRPNNYQKNLERRLEIPEDTARDLVGEVNGQIFGSIRESMKKIHGGSDDQQIPADKLPPAVDAPRLTLEDEKILADSGIKMEKTTDVNNQVTDGEVLKKENLIEALENPEVIKSGKVGMPSGFSLVRAKEIHPSTIVPPDQKLKTTVGSSPAESTYQVRSLPKKDEATEEQKRGAVDPYREPIE